jgi:hypothetical protein
VVLAHHPDADDSHAHGHRDAPPFRLGGVAAAGPPVPTLRRSS